MYAWCLLHIRSNSEQDVKITTLSYNSYTSMESKNKSRKTYQAHRENQRERILKAAEALFVQDGIDNVTIAKIAAEAQLSRVTLYEYFSNKQEVAWAVFQSIIVELRMAVESEVVQSSGTGFEKLERYFHLRGTFLQTKPEHLRFTAMFNYLYAREGSPVNLRQAIEAVWPEAYSVVAGFIRQGIQDGSIRPDLDVALSTAAINNLINGVISRLALLESKIEEEFAFHLLDIYQEIGRTYLCGIQSQPRK
jgi:AcrR family transcriptional regulator